MNLVKVIYAILCLLLITEIQLCSTIKCRSLFCTCSAINLVISSQLWPPLVTCCLISPFSLCHSITFHILEAYKANKSKLWRLLKANEKDDYLFLLIIMNF